MLIADADSTTSTQRRRLNQRVSPIVAPDMQRHFKVTAPSVHQMVITLERDGLIKRKPGIARSIQLLIPPEALPVLRWRGRQPVKASVPRY